MFRFPRIVSIGRFFALCAGLAAAEPTCGAADTFPSFSWQNPLPDGGSLNTVVYAQGKFVAGGVGGRVLTSPDGSSWTLASTIPFESVGSICFSGTQYAAVGYGGKIFTSPDAITWTSRGQAPNGNGLNGVTFADARFVAVGYNGTLLSSADGITWTLRSSPTNSQFFGIAGTTGRYVAVGSNGAIVTSTDAVTWSSVVPPAGYASTQFNGISYLNSQFIVVGGNGALLTSPDGLNWTARTTGANEWLHAVTFTGSSYIVCADTAVVLTSNDLASWTRIQLASSAPLFGITSGGGLSAVVGAGGEIETSVSGATWTSRGSSGGSYAVYDSTFVNGQFVAVGASGFVSVSADGATWTRRTTNSGHFLNAIAFGAGLYVAATGFGDVLTSPDTITWTDRTVGDNAQNWGVVFANNQFVAVGSGGTIRTSANGTSWTKVTGTGITTNFRSIAALGGVYVAVGEGGNIYTSTDGTSWTARTSGTTWNLNRVRVVDGILFAIGESRTALVSTDGATWVPLPDSQIGWAYRDVARLHDGFYVTSSIGGVLKSTDLQTWTQVATLAYQEDLWTMSMGAGHVAVGGNGGSLLESALPATGAAPAIAVPPTDRTLAAGNNAILSVVATGTGPLTFQWKKEGVDLGGATGAVLILPGAQTTASGNYSVVVSGPGGSPATSSSVVLTVNPVVAPTITALPVAAQVTAASTTFSVTAAGTAPLFYQWYRGQSGDTSNPRAGATNPTFNTPPLAASDRYWVRVTNSGGSVDSPTTTALALAPRNGFSGNSGLNGVAFGNGVYVAVGWGNVILSSTTGASWTVRSGPNGSGLKGVVFGGGTFVAVGTNGLVRTSADGATWATPSSGTANNLNAVCYDGTRFIAVGDNSTVLTSIDGSSWTTQNLGTPGVALLGVSLGSGAGVTCGYVAVAGNGAIFSTADPTTAWTSRTSNTTNSLNGVTFASSKFVAVGNAGTVRTSTDGVAWTTQNPGTGNSFSAVAFGNSQFIGITGTGYFTSGDGVTWSTFNFFTPSGEAGMSAAVFANSQWVVAGFPGLLFTSPTGAAGSWTMRNGVSAMNHNDVIYANGRYVAAADNGTIISSVDGTALSVFSPAVPGVAANLRRVAYGNGLYVVVGNNGTVLTSPDGLAWTNRTFSTTAYPAAAFGAGKFVIAGGGGAFATSSDGINWTVGTGTIGIATVDAIEFGAGLFVAVDSTGHIFTSPDATTWTARSSPVSSVLSHVLFANGKFVAVGFNSVVLTSPDGVTWTQQTLGTSGISLSKVAFGDGLYVAVHQTNAGNTNNLVFLSRDGVTWNAGSPGGGVVNSFNITTIAYGNGAFLIPGPSGLISQSVPAADTLRIATQPVAQTVGSGQSGTFSVTAAGGAPVYQWYRGFAGDTSTPVGANSSSFTTNISAHYWVRVTAGGSTIDSATADLIGPAPSITQQPVSTTVTVGQSASFTVSATSSNGTPTYQLRRNGYNVPGATSSTTPATFAINPVTQGHADLYDVLVTVGTTSVASNTVRLGVTPLAFPGLSKLDTGFDLDVESDTTGQLNVVVPYVTSTTTQILVGGEFVRVDGFGTMRRLARFDASGTLDQSFVANVNGTVNAIVVLPLQGAETQPKIVIGGNFTHVNGVARAFLARLNPNGSLDNSFNVVSGVVGAGPGNTVNAIVALPLASGETLPKLLIGGSFTSYNGPQNFNRILRLNADGTPDIPAFAAGANSNQGMNGTVNCIALDSAATGAAAGRFLIGGTFTGPSNGTTGSLNRVARLNADGTVDGTFSLGTGADNTVNAIAVDASSRVLIGGSFQNYFTAGTAATRFARLTSGGALDINFVADSTVNAIYLEDTSSASSNILIGGSFTHYGAGNTAINRLARIDSAGALDGTFNPNVNSTVFSVYKQASDSKIVLGGSFSNLAGTNPARLIARVDGTTGARDAAVLHNFRAPGQVHKVLPLPDGKLLVTGLFSHFGSAPALNIARLNSNLTFDFAYAPAGGSGYAPDSSPAVSISGGNGSNAAVTANVRATDGQIASFTVTNGGSGFTSTPTITVAAPGGGGVAALATATIFDGAITAVNLDSHLAGPNGRISTAVLQGDGKIVIGGQFTTFNGVSSGVTRIARLNADLSLDTSFNSGGAGATGDVNAIVAIPGGGYYIGGSFGNVNNASPARASVARLFSDGTLDTGFNGGTTSYTVNALALQPDGKLIAGGNFGTTSINGSSRANILRFNSSGTVDAVMTSTATNGQVRALLALPSDAQEPTGRILAGGDFTNILGSSVNRLARLKTSDGTVDGSFGINPTILNSSVFAMLRQEEAAGRVIIWGNYSNITVAGGLANSWLSRVNADGSFDPTLNVLGANLSNNLPQPSALHVLDDGTLLIGTNSVTLSGQERFGLVRLIPTTPPTISALSANAVRPGTSVTITGTDFADVTGIRFGGLNGVLASNFTVNSPTSITVTVPAAAASGQVVVQTLYGNSTSAVQLGIAPDFQLRNPLTTAGSFENIAYGNSTYVIAAVSGSIWSSTDGATWAKRFAGPNGLNGVTFANNLFVAVGNSGTIVTSPDGINWTQRPLVGTTIGLNAVAYDGTRWVVVTTGSTVVTSTDGANWSFFNSTGGNSANGLAFGANILVSVAGSGVVRTSSNSGVSWTQQTSNASNDTLNDVVFVNGVFIAGGNTGRLITSPDGITWTSRTTGSTTNFFTAGYGLISGTGKYIMGGSGSAIVSTDLVTWTTISGGAFNSRGVIYAGGQFISGGNQGNLATSPDGATWTLRLSAVQRTWRDFAYGAGRYVGVGDGGTYVNSVDGASFVVGTSPAGSSANLNGVAYGNGLFVAVGSGAVLTTSDGVAWTARTPSGAPTFTSVAFGGGIWVAVASNGGAYRSTDGVTFSSINTGNANALNYVTYGGSPAKFVAVGASNGTAGTILTSTDGATNTWTPQTSNAGNNALNGVTFANGKFVALGANSTLVTSPDGVTWTARTMPSAGFPLSRVAFGDGYFVAVANTNNVFFTSSDAIAWVQVAPSLEVFNSSNGSAIAYGNGRFVVGAGLGFLASTNPASDTLQITAQPASQAFTSGNSVALSVTTVGGTNYQWYSGVSGDTSTPATGGTGANTANYTTPALTASARYWVRVTDANGAVVDSTTATLLGPPAITLNPIAQTVNEGSNVSFTVAAFGSGTLNYQWKKDGGDVGTNSPTYSITQVTAAQGGNYSVVVSNSAGSNTAGPVLLTVNPVAPTMTQQASFGQGTIAITGSFVDLQMNVTGTQPITVQWKKNGVNLGAPVVPDATGIAHYYLPGIQPSEAGPYTAIATNALGSSPEIANNQAQFVVNQPAWSWRQPFPTPLTLTNVSANPDGGFFLFGNRGYFADSDDGAGWSQSVGLTSQTMLGYVFGNNRHLFWASDFFATAEKNGANLVKSHLPTIETVNEVAFGKGLFVAVCSSGKIFTSPDAITWTERVSNTTEGLFEATFGNNTFAVSTGSGQIITSADGITWAAPHASPSDNVWLLRYANGKLYLGNNTGQLYSSTDTINWTTLTSGVGTRLTDLQYANGRYLIVGSSGVILTSDNGVDWTKQTTNVTTPLLYAAYSGGTWVATGNNGSPNGSAILRSTDNGVTWVKQNGFNTTQQLNGVATSPTAIVAVGNGGAIMSSTVPAVPAGQTAADAGWSWQFAASGNGSAALNEVTYLGTTFYAVGAGGAIRSSTDGGNNWTSPASGTTNNLFWVGTLKAQLYAAGATGTLLNFNGTNWSTFATGSTSQLNGAAYASIGTSPAIDTYVLVGSGGTILTSSTGAASSWSAATSGTAQNLNEVAFGNGTFVAVGDTGTILTSANGATWTSRGFGLPENFTHVGFTSGIFIVSGSASGVFTSADGVTWTPRYAGTNSTTIRATSAAFGGRVYGVGAAGAVLAADLIPQIENVTVGTPVAGGSATFRTDFFEPLLPVTFQWNRGGLPIAGATGPNYTIPNATRADAGIYDVTVTTAARDTGSDPVLLNVAPTVYPGQIAADLSWDPNPVTISTRTFAAVKLSDGKFMVGGESVSWQNAQGQLQTRTALARLNADLTLDTTWTPPVVNGIVYALAVASDGTVYFGGEFSAVDGHLRPNLARLIVVGGNLVHDLGWRPSDPQPTGGTFQVSALAVQTDGKLLVARQSFVPGVIGGTNVLRRLDVDGAQDGSFSTNITVGTGPRVTSLIAEPIVGGDSTSGMIAFAGSFTQVNGVAHNAVARVSNDGATVDASFAGVGTTGSNNGVNYLSRLTDGRYLLVGNFSQVNGLTRNRIAILNATDGSVDTTFVTASGTTTGSIQGATLLPDSINGDRILAVGNFNQYAGVNAAGIVRLNAGTGAVDTGFTVGAGAQASSLIPGTSGAGRNLHAFTLANNRVALVGTFNQLLGQRRVAVAVVDGAVTNVDASDPTKTLLASPASLVYRPAFTGAAFLESNGELTVFGSIDAAAGVTGLGQMARFKPDGSLDANFPGGSGLGLTGLSTFGVYRGTRQGDGKYVVTGDIASYNGSPANHIVRINTDGSIDSSFNPGAGPSNFIVTPYSLSGGDTLLFGSIGAGFTYDNVTVTGNIMRVNANGTRNAGFNPGTGFGGGVPTAVIEVPSADNPLGYPILAGGPFTSYNGVSVPGIVAINADGSRLTDFNPGTGVTGGSIAGFTFLSPGRVLMYGSFTGYNGTAANHLAVLDLENGGLDLSFSAPVELDAAVGQAVAQEDGKIVVTGEFSRGLVLRLNANGTLDPSFALQGITGYPGGGGATRVLMSDDGSVYLHNSLFSLNNQAPRALVRFKGAATIPVVSVPPIGGTLNLGVNNLLWVRAGGTGPYTYQWRKNSTNIDGATDSVLVIPNATPADAGAYDVIVTGPGGSVTSAAAALATTVTILDQPTSRRVVAGGKVLLRVSAATTVNGATLTYQWRKNGANIGGANASDYSIASVAAGDAATFSVLVGDGTNTIPSQNAVLTVLTPDNVLWQQFTEFSTEQASTRTINDGNGHVYVPWSIFDRNPDMVAGRVVGALVRLNVSDGTIDPAFKLDPRFRRAAHVAIQTDGKLIIAVTAGDADTVIRVDSTGAVDGSFQAPLFARGIRFVTLQPDGKVLLTAADLLNVNAPAGALASAAPGVYRLNGTNGSLDSGFTPTTFGADAGGNFNIFGPPVVDSSNRIYLVGTFGSVNGTARVNIARLAPDGTLDSAYANPANTASLPAGFASNQVRAVVFQSDGRAVFVGDFRYNGRGTVNGSDRIMAIRLSTTGNLDLGYHMPLRSELGYNTSIGIRMRYAIALPNDQLLGIADRLTRLNADGTVDGSFVGRAFGKESFWISQDASGRFYVPDQISVAGRALTLQLWGNGIARFTPDGTPDESFQTGGWGRSAIPTNGAVLSDGRVWVGGEFNRFGSTHVPGLAQFAAAGGLTGTQVTSTRSMTLGAVASAGNDQIFVVVAPPSNSTETAAPVLARLNADGTPDSNFTPTIPSNYSLGTATPTAAPGGRVLVATAFIDPQSVLNGATGDSILRFNAGGSRDTGYNPPLASLAAVDRGAGNAINQIRTAGLNIAQVLADDRVLVIYAALNGSLHLSRLDATTGAVDGSFNPPSFGTVASDGGFSGFIHDPVTNTTDQFSLTTYDPSNLVRAALQVPDGRVYVGGRFSLAGKPLGLVRLMTDGTIDDTFAGAGIAFGKSDAGPYVSSLAVDSAGRVYVAGRFDSFNGVAVPGLFRLNADGSLDPGWAPGFVVRDAPVASVRLSVVGTKLYAFGTVAAVADPFVGPYRVVDIPPPPSIATAPVTANVVNGGSATFTVVAGGTGPFTYQWFKNGTLIPTATNATYTINPVSGTDVANYTVAITGPTGKTVTAPVPLVINVPVSITTPPQAQAVSSGASFTLSVGLAGSSPFTYQWRKDGTAISGATNATYAVTSATDTGTGSAGFGTTGDAGDYTVFVTNLVSNTTSSPAAHVTVLPPGFSATHAVVGAGYVAGSTVTITNTINYSGTLDSLGWQVLLPAGWSYASSGGNVGSVKPRSSPPDTGTLSWAWTDIPDSPIEFTYTLNVPAGTTGPQTIAALMLPTQAGIHYMLLAKPDPLVIDKVAFHSADTNKDGFIALTELLRVIELYNTRNGTVRTGAYAVDPTNTEDGFATDTARSSTAVVTLSKYHSADTNHDGSLSLTELLRVIELYNYRSGTVRTGQYHIDPTNTEDGFAPGP